MRHVASEHKEGIFLQRDVGIVAPHKWGALVVFEDQQGSITVNHSALALIMAIRVKRKTSRKFGDFNHDRGHFVVFSIGIARLVFGVLVVVVDMFASLTEPKSVQTVNDLLQKWNIVRQETVHAVGSLKGLVHVRLVHGKFVGLEEVLEDLNVFLRKRRWGSHAVAVVLVLVDRWEFVPFGERKTSKQTRIFLH